MSEYYEGETEDIWMNDSAIAFQIRKRDQIGQNLEAAQARHMQANSRINRALGKIPMLLHGARLAAQSSTVDEYTQFLQPNHYCPIVDIEQVVNVTAF